MIYKRWWFWVLVIFIIGSVAPDTKNNDSTAPSDGGNTSVSDNAPPIDDATEPEGESQTVSAPDNTNTPTEKSENDTPDTESSVIDSVPEEAIEYDALQQLYLDISADMSYTEMIDLVKSTGLPYSEEQYNGSRAVQVAFTEGCTKQRYKREYGDYLKIYYEYPRDENSSADKLEKYYFRSCEYVPIHSQMVLMSYKNGRYSGVSGISEYGNYITILGNVLDLDANMTKEEQLKYFMNDLKAENS